MVCSFGDASVNHSTAAGALNAAGYTAFQGLPLPLLLVCEDNGLGISVPDAARLDRGGRIGPARAQVLRAPTAATWPTRMTPRRPPRRTCGSAGPRRSCTCARSGSAGTRAPTSSRPTAAPAEIAADADRDPLLGTARLLVESGAMAPADVLDRYEAIKARVLALAGELAGRTAAGRRDRDHGPDRAAPPGHGGRQPRGPGPPGQRLAAAPRLRRAAARGRGPADARAGHQPHARRRAGGPAGNDRVRRGRRPARAESTG